MNMIPRNPDVLRLLSTDDYENDQTAKSSPIKIKNLSPLPPDTILGKNSSAALASLPEKNAFGINYNKLTKQHSIGKEIIKFNLDNIILKGKEREITPGMWCLLTQSDVPNPKDYTKEDLDKYKQILIETDSIYKNNDRSTGKAKSSGGDKYMRLIRPIWKAIKGEKTPTTPTEILNPTIPDFPTIPITSSKPKNPTIPTTDILKPTIATENKGAGLMNYTNNEIKYCWIDNMKQLNERLHLIAAEEKAGNYVYHNEKLGENNYHLDKIQLDKLKNAKEKKSGVSLEIRSSQIKNKKGGFLPLIFGGIGAATALVGVVTSIVNTVNDYKHKKAIEKETIRHNKGMENKDKMILAKELHKPVRKKFPKRRIFTKGIDDLWAADLVIMRNYSDENKGYSYIITVIDTFSKFSWAFEIKKKDGINVSEAFEKKIIKQAISQKHQAPKLLHADKGLEFENKHFKKVLQEYGIKMYHTQNEEKSSIIERFNRTLNSKMRLHFEVTNSKKWIKIFKSLIYQYNFKDIHRSIGMRPCEVNKSNEDVVFHKLFSTKNKPKPKIKFSVGDSVRITASRKTLGNK
ncbi:hypothetical protein QTP88_028854 [Uroleucon formosanum]